MAEVIGNVAPSSFEGSPSASGRKTIKIAAIFFMR
jgi:hypothetical protein